MNTPINRVQLTGHLGKDPELQSTSNGNKYVRLSLATNEPYTNRAGERVTETHWHNLVAWGGLAERIAGTMNKGLEVTVEGNLRSRSWEDKDGNRRYTTEVVLNDCQRVTRDVAVAQTADA